MSHVPPAGKGDEQRADESYKATDITHEPPPSGIRRGCKERHRWTAWCLTCHIHTSRMDERGTGTGGLGGCPHISGCRLVLPGLCPPLFLDSPTLIPHSIVGGLPSSIGGAASSFTCVGGCSGSFWRPPWALPAVMVVFSFNANLFTLHTKTNWSISDYISWICLLNRT